MDEVANIIGIIAAILAGDSHSKKTVGPLAEHASAFAAALEQGFHSGGWKGAVTKGIEVRVGSRSGLLAEIHCRNRRGFDRLRRRTDSPGRILPRLMASTNGKKLPTKRGVRKTGIPNCALKSRRFRRIIGL